MKKDTTKKITRLAMLCGLSVVLMLFVRFPIIPAAPYLEYSPFDIPLLIAAFLYGPWYGVAAGFVVCVLQGITVSSASGPIGILMNLITTAVLCLVAGLIYRRKKNVKGAIIALAAGSAALVLAAIPCNLFLTPLYAPWLDIKGVAAMIIPILLPFNLFRVVVNSIGAFAIYKPIGRLFHGKNG